MSAPVKKSRLWRVTYLVEIIILALPTLAIMTLVALVGTVYCAGATLASVSSAQSVSMTLLAVVGTLTCISGLAAIFKFCRLSIVYIFSGETNLRNYRREFLVGLRLAIAPLVVTIGFSIFAAYTDPAGWPLLPHLSGVVLFIPITHLWLALREAGRATMKESG